MNRRKELWLRLAAALFCMLGASAIHARELPIRVWQLQDYNMPHIKRMIALAAEHKVNRIQLSHDIVMMAEQVLENPKRAQDINTICRWAHERGLRADVWTHELETIPKDMLTDGKLNLDDDAIWKRTRERYQRLFALCPGIDGLVLTMHETAVMVWDDAKVRSSLSPAARVTKLIDELDSVCRPQKRQLFVRTFAYEPRQLACIVEGIRSSSSNVTAMSKCVPHDWQPYYPNDPSIGVLAPKRQIVEFDLGNEFTGLSTIPYLDFKLLASRLRYGVAKGISGAVFRVERLRWRAVDTPNMANIAIMTRLLRDPSLDQRKLFREWLEVSYPRRTIRFLESAFTRSFDIVNKGYFVLGFWVTNHSRLPDYGYAKRSLYGRTTAKWDPSTRPVEQALFNPSRQTIARISREKDEALRLADLSLADVDSAGPWLRRADYRTLRNLFEREKAMVLVWKPAMEVIFGIDVLQRTRAAGDREFLLAAAGRLETAAEANKALLIQMAGDYVNPGNTENYDKAMQLARRGRDAAGAD